MRLLLDTNVVLALLDEQLVALEDRARDALASSEAVLYASVASLWEIAIKVRLRKLWVSVPLRSLPEVLERMRIQILVINHHHVLTVVEPEHATRDPFDRLLLAQCTIENLRLVTVDRILRKHPLAWRPA